MHLPADLKSENPIIHISLNPHPDDVLSDNQLADIAKEYMDKLGYGNQPYMVYKHCDIARHHIHIVSIRVADTGKKINDKFEHVRSKQITRELEQKYGLHSAEKKQAADRPELKKVDYRAGDVKHQLSNTVKALAGSYRFQSFTEYKVLLSIYNVQAEEVKGEVNGKPYNGIVYSATNDKGEKQGNPFKSSSLGKSVGYEAIQRHIKRSAKDIQDKNLKERTRRTVGAAMKSARSRELLITELKAKGIDVLFRQNDTGRIYGVTFIDHENRTVLNGSRLGKDFSANVFNDLFTGSRTLTGNSKQDVREYSSKESHPHQQTGQLSEGTGNAIGGTWLLPGGDETPPDNSQVPPPKKKKKKKQKRI